MILRKPSLSPKRKKGKGQTGTAALPNIPNPRIVYTVEADAVPARHMGFQVRRVVMV
jgi:hypothetical protein